ncbi:chorismate lyase [Phormidium tenue]|jgi:chorismate lyase|uniref:Chorismate lyase n=1 Tax=Phormidium tenue FACHB-1050 TaxID=2692857 RepID=A0ABR8CDC6_9CYAN|nr:chorismate lyase [Phormidium tenue]MBD2318336.1 chorismate lyase [Phormidium tenue FACHB-1050]
MTISSAQSIQIPDSQSLNGESISAWNRIEEPMWQGSEADIRKGLPFNLLSPTWQMFLMGDGAPTRHLQLLTQSDISVEVLAMTNIGDDDDNAPSDISLIASPRIRRQIFLRSQQTGEIFSHATSWWSEAAMQKYLKDPSLPIWVSLNQKYTELYRDLKGIYKGACPNLAKAFGYPEVDTYWARHYLLWHGGEPITMLYEIYSPAIGKYLGSSSL